MSAHDEITLRVEVPESTEAHISTEVSCGGTSVHVYEHGHQGSGHWAVWLYKSGHVISGGTIGYTREQALADAHAYVCRKERQRLMFEQLKEALVEGGGQDD